MNSLTILQGDCCETLKTLPDESVQCCVTSPPYWKLRDYDHPRQIGQEKTIDEFVQSLVTVFREVRRTIKPDGTLWVNIGDSYASNWPCNRRSEVGNGSLENGKREARPPRMPDGLKDKDIVGVPWRVAFALQADGWWLRSDNIWGKPNGMPESVTDRPTRAHEYVFQLTKSADYFYDYEAVRLPPLPSSVARLEQHIEGQLGSIRANGGSKTNGTMKAVSRTTDKQRGHSRRHEGFNDRWDAMEKQQQQQGGAALRSVWWITPAQCDDAHFAVMPNNLAALCIMASSRTGDTILDPFGGSGTTGQMAIELGREAILCELNPEYIPLIEQRTSTTPGLAL